MIRFALRCEQGHDFEAWFATSKAFEAQKTAGAVECPVCGTAAVDKGLMAPAIGAVGRKEPPRKRAASTTRKPKSAASMARRPRRK